MRHPRWRLFAPLTVAALAIPAALAGGGITSSASSAASNAPSHIDCSNSNRFLCTEVNQSDEVFGHYVGHDEPSVLFYSNKSGSGNQMQYSGQLPVEPTATNVAGKHVYTFEYAAAFWFGMAMCDSQSYPELVNSCVPDSNANIVNPAKSPYHPGTAYMELQFYPPGYVQQWNGFSCSATQWCVALTIDSLALNSLTGEQLNSTCESVVGEEYVNFAYLTHSGKPQGPPNPVQFTPAASGNPNPAKVEFLNQGDAFTVNLHDTPHGLQAVVKDTTNGSSGSMTASASNGFGQVKFAPSPSTQCKNIPYDFHPMYATSSPQTTVPWAAATYNVAMDTEVGHFDYCSKVDSTTGSCLGHEGVGKNAEPNDGDDFGCWAPSASSLIKIGGCEGSNVGYDGTSYLADWPNGSSSRPTNFIFTSPLTGAHYDTNYSSVGFNTDLPAIEDNLGTCDTSTGAGCTIIPPTDDGTPAQFYPFYSTGHALGGCAWTVGQNYPGFSTNNFGAHQQYGHLLKVAYSGAAGSVSYSFNDYQNNLPNNPCPAA
ncbi:MAG TPA: hypothetical protein VMU65_13035 [Candidatus Saccharimonadales bacterium]|nr:hypothetical protein [Candidatus Saccharimonadales bacterium]